jgi:hypothetical protein
MKTFERTRIDYEAIRSYFGNLVVGGVEPATGLCAIIDQKEQSNKYWFAAKGARTWPLRGRIFFLD